LVLGNIGENVIIEFLISNGLTYLESNDDNRYDFIMLKDNVKTTYEVKTDVLCELYW
jgi:Holliday junction resolvase-like predicted endonuclease